MPELPEPLFFSASDREQMLSRGMEPDLVEGQLSIFRNPPAPLELSQTCRRGYGIRRLDTEAGELEALWRTAARRGRFLKLVPASGAASRMFAFLQEAEPWLRQSGTAELRRQAASGSAAAEMTQQFLAELERFPFFDRLREAAAQRGEGTWDELRDRNPIAVIDILLSSPGLGLATLPKGLVPFHRYGSEIRSAFEEHLVEGTGYLAADASPHSFHFTVTAEQSEKFRDLVDRLTPKLQDALGFSLQIEFSDQPLATDTLAVDLDNRPARDARGRLVFRPGGHGALLTNLRRLAGDLVFIKNIDNVAPQRSHLEVGRWKRLLAGHLVRLQRRVFELIDHLRAEREAQSQLQSAFDFLEEELVLRPPRGIREAELAEQRHYLLDRLDRPLRVCGVVLNRGEPGGAPFWVEEADGTLAGQIVEPGQVDRTRHEQRRIWKSSTHFNPVDLVCALRDRDGRPYDLTRFVDDRTHFISPRRLGAMPIKVLELPGLWNGAMAGWNTVFAEVPEATFTPVKTVLDLLRPEHQP